MARLGPSRSKNVDFPLVFKAKIRKTLKKRYVLKASNGKTPARIKKISEKKKEQQRTGSGSHRFSAAGSKIMLNYARRSRESDWRRLGGANNNNY